HLTCNGAHAAMFLAGLAALDQECVFSEAAGIQEERDTMTVAHRAYLADVRQAHRLAAPAVVRHGQHTNRNMSSAVVFDKLFELCRIQITFERMAASRIDALIDNESNSRRAGVLDGGPRRVEVIVAGDKLSRATEELKKNSFACPALMSREDVRHSR